MSTQVCFVCHFSKGDTSSVVRSINTRCRDCHDAPARPFKRGVAEIDHTKFVAAKLDCDQLCHNKQVDPNTHVPDVSCLDCHAFRNQGQNNSRDLHILHSGKDKVECLACHEMINHSAGPIKKHHTSLQCSQCHQVPFEGTRLAEAGFIKLPGDCSLCHSNPHSGQFEKTCQQCHSEHGWTRPWLTNIHGTDASFPLRGKHKSVECSKCHIGPRLSQARFTGLPRTGEQCHPDPHDGQFTQGCTTCHSEQGWKNRLIDPHGPGSSHPLRGKHAVLECVKCHVPPRPGAPLAEARFVGLADKGCASCHEDPHGGQMHSACNTCHTEQGWTGKSLLFTHNKNSEFKLNPLHADLACTSCHTKADQHLFRPLPKTCELCHTDIVRLRFAEDYPAVGRPDPHASRVSCVQCHSPDKPHQAPADYAGACRGCHNPYYEGLFYNWMKSFSIRESQAELLLKRLRNQNAPEAEVVEQKIKQAKKAGFHNFSLALKLWDEILANGFDKRGQTK